MNALRCVGTYLDANEGSTVTLTREGYGYTATLRDAAGEPVTTGDAPTALGAMLDLEEAIIDSM